jgi:hypothetical protein
MNSQPGPFALRFARAVLALVVLTSGSLFAQSAPTVELNRAEAPRYLNDIKALTTPAMEGRGDGSKGLTLAEHLIERRYKELGLEPAGSQGYQQPFSLVTGARLKGANHLRVETAEHKFDLKLHEEYVPFSFSSSGVASGGLAFAGYGITAPEFGYDDYAGLDVKDKIVVVLRYEPAAFAEKSGHQGLTHHSQLITKAINARDHGAKAVVLVNGRLQPGEEDLLTRFGSVSGPRDAGILLVQVKNAEAEKWFAAAGKSISQIQLGIDHAGKPASFAFPDGMRASVNVGIEQTHATVNNVLAYLPGQTDEYVIVGAHYDHLGRGYYDSLAPSQIGQIHPGADDNASGTAGVLELARYFAPMKGKLRRGILFANFAGEELGLLGSAEWVKEPTRPLDKAVAMLNMDMIGRIRDGKVYIGGVGTGSNFASLLKAEPNPAHFKIDYSQGGPSSSDHTSFISKKIPSLFFFSGLHSDYHKPSDTWEKINSQGAVELLALVAQVTEQLASEPERVAFQAVKEEKPMGGVAGGGGGYGPYFGSVPDFGEIENGVRFSDIRPGSPADKAGFKAGDVLVKFGDKPIKNLYDFTDALRRSRIGDVVEVTVLRDGKPVTAKVTLEQRK